MHFQGQCGFGVMRSISSAPQLFDPQGSWTISLPIFKKANGASPPENFSAWETA
jgi:hypothetical protein